MAFCEKILVPRVLCDEIFYIEDNEFAIPVGKSRSHRAVRSAAS